MGILADEEEGWGGGGGGGGVGDPKASPLQMKCGVMCTSVNTYDYFILAPSRNSL